MTTSWIRVLASPSAGGRAAWVAVPRPERAGAEAPADEGPRIAAGAVTDALTTAFMLLSSEEIAALCERSPGLGGLGPAGICRRTVVRRGTAPFRRSRRLEIESRRRILQPVASIA